MNSELKDYVESNKKLPWGAMFYKILWEQMPKMTNTKILDFGSGLGFTANHFAKDNEVLAIDPDAEMLSERIHENNYQQINGSIENLKEQTDNSFDLIVCHNVLEYAKERKEIFNEFCRVLKPNGIISIVKHNHNGRIMQKIAFQNNLDEALSILDGGDTSAAYFGKINYYNVSDIINWSDDTNISVEKILGIRTFYALNTNNEARFDPAWQKKMFELEMKVSDMEDYKKIAFFNHVLLRKHR